jgi:hypothetical protein
MLDDVLAFHDRLTICVGAAVPVPVNDSVVVEGCALLAKVSVAIAAPEVDGLKVTVKGALLPASIVTGNDSPLTLNAELLVVAAVTVTLVPAADKLPDAVLLIPATTLPTPSVAGLTASCASPDEPDPDPEELEDSDEPEEPLLAP